MKPAEPEKKALELIHDSHVMNLATSGEAGPWAAPVYYIFHKSCFYFFSSPDARHIREAASSGTAAASIHAGGTSIASIRGLQMSGTIQSAGMGLTSAAAFKTYLTRFDFLENLSQEGAKIENIRSLETLFRAKWYCFEPDTSLYMDNSLGFGHKQPVTL